MWFFPKDKRPGRYEAKYIANMKSHYIYKSLSNKTKNLGGKRSQLTPFNRRLHWLKQLHFYPPQFLSIVFTLKIPVILFLACIRLSTLELHRPIQSSFSNVYPFFLSMYLLPHSTNFKLNSQGKKMSGNFWIQLFRFVGAINQMGWFLVQFY